jgi:hypothetical protein
MSFHETKKRSRRLRFLDYMIECRKAQLGLAAAPDIPSPLSHNLARVDGHSSNSNSRPRAAFLTPLLTVLEKGVEERCRNEYSVDGTGDLFTTVTRALKAWARFGFGPTQQQQPQQQQRQ